ncbi:hypothetical protein E8E14_006940 [Neopestalotiopsis sp. 37M]|nr:hypothetical protein E8E14_006940 [Neopestalotiopsis sp. 37M]
MMITLMTDEVHDLDTSRAATMMTEVDDLDVALLMPMNSEAGSGRESRGEPLRNQVGWHGSQPTNHLFDIVGDLRGDSRTSASRPRGDRMISGGSQSVRHKKMGTKYSRSQDYGN